MIYLVAEIIDGTDNELLKFKSLDSAIEYIQDEQITEFVLSTKPVKPYPEDDYTLIEDIPEEERNREL
jgi:hypothetical protein